jgi:hypothetical protein
VPPPDITIQPKTGTAIEIAPFHQDIDGTVFKDQNGNGVRDQDEIGLPGITVFIDANNNGRRDPGEQFTVTDANGVYDFDSVATLPGPGTYNVRAIVPAGYRQTTPNPRPGPTIHIVTNLGADIGTVLIGLQRTDTLVIGTDQGGAPRVTVRFLDGGHDNFTFMAYEAGFTGGVRVATADLVSPGSGTSFNPDGTPDIITAPGPGRVGEVRIFNGTAPGAPVESLFPFGNTYAGGVFVAVADVTGDGVPDIIMGSGIGIAAEVRIFDFANQRFLPTNIFPYVGTFKNGVHVAAGDMNGDGRAEVVTAPANGIAPIVRVFNVNFNAVTGNDAPSLLRSILAYASSYTGGVWVAAEDNIIVTGPGLNSTPVVKVFNGSGILQGSFQAYTFQQAANGVRVALCELDDTGQSTGVPDTLPEIVTAPGPGSQPLVRYFHSTSPFSEYATFGFWAFEPNYNGGLFIAGSSRAPA